MFETDVKLLKLGRIKQCNLIYFGINTSRSALEVQLWLVLLWFHTGWGRSVSVGFWRKNRGFGRFRFFDQHQNELRTDI